MIKKLSALAVGAMMTASAQAAFITGAIAISDGFDAAGIPTAPTGTIASGLTSFDLQNAVNVYTAGSGTTDLAGVTAATASDFLPPALPTTFLTATAGATTFTFTLTSFVASGSTPLSCNAQGLCTDEKDWNIAGVVDDGPGGFDPTAFIGTWTASGSCLGSTNGSAQCDSNIALSWQSTLVATGRQQAPEPATLALLGLGLAGLGFARRRKA